MKKIARILILLWLVNFVLISCKKEKDETIQIVNHEIYKLMEEVYLWYEKTLDRVFLRGLSALRSGKTINWFETIQEEVSATA